MVGSVTSALAYTAIEAPTEAQHLEVLTKLSVAIEEVRGVFQNVPARGARDGWYPFEPVKQIYEEVRQLGFGPSIDNERRTAAHDRIYAMWKLNRTHFLAEFDRDEPTHHHAHYATLVSRRRVTESNA
jgi:hypothetical protein